MANTYIVVSVVSNHPAEWEKNYAYANRIVGAVEYANIEQAKARSEQLTKDWHEAHDAYAVLSRKGDMIATMNLRAMGDECPKFIVHELVPVGLTPVAALPSLDLKDVSLPPGT